ncbi:MAG TPA: UvrD-helicase domain-containing protein [Bryobacteraceae bacterium]|nr:UvrD-helicase domain-containing protein [Bryobacteraceae bacterium]
MILSPQQRAAVERDAPEVCVVAGPGSGKTRVLVERFAWLVEQRGVDPGRILAITFTEKAANEMKRRLAKRFADSPEHRERIETAWLSTIDAFCARLLGEHAIQAGLPPDFEVLEPAQADRLLRDAAEEILDEMFAEHPANMRRLLEALDLSTDDDARKPDLAQSLIDAYETMRLSGRRELPDPTPAPDLVPEARDLVRTAAGSLPGWAERFLALPEAAAREHLEVLASFSVNLTRITPKSSPAYQAASRLKKEILPQLEAQWVERWHDGLSELIGNALSRVDSRYQEKKRRQGAVDFAGLEEKAIELLESDTDLRRRIANRFDHVLMDELQDTNRLQWRLIDLIRRNLFAVGDVNQSIYGFRHADPTVFEDYRRHACVEELTENYRSRSEILNAVSRLLDGQPGVETRDLQARREFATSREPVVARITGAGPRAAEAEGDMVASQIRAWVDAGEREYRDIAVLVRTLGSTAPFEQAFDRLRIPFLLSGGRTFLEARETKDLMALLTALANPLDEVAVVTVLRSPLVNWSDEQIMAASHEGWQAEFERLFGRVRKLAGFVPLDRLLAQKLDECGYLAGLGDRARANVDKLLGWIRREERRRPRPLVELAEDLEDLRETQAEAEAPPPEAAEAARIMTIHAAKGLEFPVVFLSAMHRGPERRLPVILFGPNRGLGIKWRNPVTGGGLPSAAYRELAKLRTGEEEAEENRLLYVAMTRAEDRLILSYAERPRSSRWMKLAASVEEIAAPAAATSPDGELLRAVAIPTPVVSISGQYDSPTPVTSIALFDVCPRKYYLGRYLGLEPDSDAPGSGAIELGLDVHRALAGEEAFSEEARALAQQFHASDLGRRAARASRIEREFDFLFAVEDVILSGRIDLWFEEEGKLVLVDFKTDREESSNGRYDLQLRLYALALERYVGRLPDRAVVFYVRSARSVEIGLESERLEAARAAVRALAAAQNALEFPMKPGKQCRRCGFFGGLCTPLLGGHLTLERSPEPVF